MISFRDRDPIRIGLICLAAMVVLLAIAFDFNRIPFISQSYLLNAEFTDASGIAAGNEVRVAGVKVGSVKEVRLMRDRVLVQMSIDDSVAIPEKATARIGLSTILGTKFVGIEARSDGKPLTPGSTIPLARTSIPFEIYQASGSTVRVLSDIDAMQLNDGFRALAELADDPNRDVAKTLAGAGQVTGAIASRANELEKLAVKGEALLETLDASSGDIQEVITNSNKILEVIDRRRAIVRDLLRNTDLLTHSLGGLLKENHSELDSILKDLHATLVVVDRDLGELEKALVLLGPSTQGFARALWTGRWGNICIESIDSVNGTITGSGAPPNDPVSCDSANAK